MKQVPFFQVDAFTDEIFKGNPAAICVLDAWPDDQVLRNIAIENNLAETAYIIAENDGFAIRWFTNLGEIDLCGHATLASAHVVFQHLGYEKPRVRFTTRHVGALIVTYRDGNYVMDFPARAAIEETLTPGAIVDGLGGAKPVRTFVARDYMAVFQDVETILNLQPDFRTLAKAGKMIAVTAPGRDCDYVSRFFCPGDSVEEDPVTGSAHCMMAPYWAKALGKNDLTAIQYSPRGMAGILCRVVGDRVELRGKAVTVIVGSLILP